MVVFYVRNLKKKMINKSMKNACAVISISNKITVDHDFFTGTKYIFASFDRMILNNENIVLMKDHIFRLKKILLSTGIYFCLSH